MMTVESDSQVIALWRRPLHRYTTHLFAAVMRFSMGGDVMETRDTLKNVRYSLVQSLVISLVTGICVIIGAVLAQRLLHLPVSYNMIAELILIFWAITVIVGVVLTLLTRQQ
ncbi:MAG TPA: hypothetical protein VK436_08090 [Methanocella sp.]|nr:hypothetical protein [Methanocella sp.]